MFEQYIINENITVFYKSDDKDEMLSIFDDVDKELEKIDKITGLSLKIKLRVYYTDSMLSVMFHTTTFSRKIAMILFLPFWYGKAKKYWNYSKGWLMKNNFVNSIVLKNSEGVKKSVSFNKVIYNKKFEEKNVLDQQKRVFFHQYIQALLSKTSKPEWFEEGISYYMLEKYYGSQLIRDETLEMVQQMPDSSVEDILFNGVKGYWMIRYIDSKYPQLIDELLNEIKDGKIESIEKPLFSKLDEVEDKKALFEKAYASFAQSEGVD